MEPPTAAGNRRRSLRTLRTNPDRLAECGHDLMHVDPSSERDLKCDICWRNRETLILRMLEPFERALKVEPEDLAKILEKEQAERNLRMNEERRMRERREDERRRKDEETKRKRERMRAMQEARRGKGGKFEKKQKTEHPPPPPKGPASDKSYNNWKDIAGKKRAGNGKFMKGGSVDQSSEGSMSMERDMEATPSVTGWEESSWSPGGLENKFIFGQPTPSPTGSERNPPVTSTATTLNAGSVGSMWSQVDGQNGKHGFVKEEPDTAMEGYSSINYNAIPTETAVAGVLPQQEQPHRNGEPYALAAPMPAAASPPEAVTKEEVMEDVPMEFTAPLAPTPTGVAPDQTIDASRHPPPPRLQSRSRASSIVIPSEAPSAPPVAPGLTAPSNENASRVQIPFQFTMEARATRRRSASSTRSVSKPLSPTATKVKAKAKSQGRRASATSITPTPLPSGSIQPLRFIHTTAPPQPHGAGDKAAAERSMQPLQQRTLLSFFQVSGSGDSTMTTTAAAPMPAFTAGGNAGLPTVATPSAAEATAQREKDLKRASKGREAVRLRDEDPNRRKSQRSSTAINYFESSDDDEDDGAA